MSKKFKKYLRSLIREELGRNYHTLDNSPYSYSEHPDYDVEIYATPPDNYLLDVRYNDQKLGHNIKFNTREEAEHYARQVVEKHRLKIANNLRADY